MNVAQHIKPTIMNRFGMNKLSFIFICIIMITSCQNNQQQAATCCNQPASNCNNWEAQLAEKLPYLGHRNWILIADMAYPLQSGDGIITIYADAPYLEVLEKVKKRDANEPEFLQTVCEIFESLEYVITEEDMPGVDNLRKEMARICGDEAQSILHEELLKRMDEAGKLYSIVVIKTTLTMAYTTSFFELDCAYWNGEKQVNLDKAMGK